MARKFGTHIDLSGNQLLNALAQILSAAPGSPKSGQMYYDSTLKKWGYYNGTTFVYPTEGGGAEASSSTLGTIKTTGDLGGTGASPTVVHFTLTSDSSANNHKVTNLAEPTASTDATTKAYVDAKVNGLSWKNPVVAATAAALPAYTQTGSGATGTLEANANAALTVDGYAVQVGDRILVKNGAAAKDNGIYEVTQKGAAGEKWKLLRTADANSGALILQATMLVEKGTENKDHTFNCSTEPVITLDTTALEFVETGGIEIVGDGKYTQRTGNVIEAKPDATVPAEPAEGAVSAEGEGAMRKKTFRVRGNAALTEFTLTHNLNTRQIIVQGQENSGGSATVPIELDWEPTSANAVKLTFPSAPAAATNYFVTVIG